MPELIPAAVAFASRADLKLSPVVGALFDAVEGNVDRTAIARIVDLDPTIAMAVLRVANTARYSRSSQCTSVDQAVGRLGVRRLLEIVNNIAGAPMRVADVEGFALRRHTLWRMSVATAFACREAADCRGRSPARAYTVGLLLDIGKIAMAKSLDATGLEPGEPFIHFERRALDCDHAQVGAAIATANGLPDAIVECIRLHHDPRGCATPEVHVAHVGSALAAQLLPEGVEGLTNPLYDESVERLGLSESDLLQILEAGVDGLVEAEAWCEPVGSA